MIDSEDPPKWSPRRRLLFVLVSGLGCWAAVWLAAWVIIKASGE